MTFTIIKEKANWPKPSPRYARLAATWRAAGIDIKDDELGRIDAILDGERWDEGRNRTKQDSKEIDPIDLFSADSLRDSGYMSQDTPSPDPLIDGFLPRTKPFLMN
jgi:hypothetical protein